MEISEVSVSFCSSAVDRAAPRVARWLGLAAVVAGVAALAFASLGLGLGLIAVGCASLALVHGFSRSSAGASRPLTAESLCEKAGTELTIAPPQIPAPSAEDVAVPRPPLVTADSSSLPKVTQNLVLDPRQSPDSSKEFENAFPAHRENSLPILSSSECIPNVAQTLVLDCSESPAVQNQRLSHVRDSASRCARCMQGAVKVAALAADLFRYGIVVWVLSQAAGREGLAIVLRSWVHPFGWGELAPSSAGINLAEQTPAVWDAGFYYGVFETCRGSNGTTASSSF
jgi:hypothetical protein